MPITGGSSGGGGTPDDNSVSTAKIVDNAVTVDKIADDAVDSAQIVDGAVDEVHLHADVIAQLGGGGGESAELDYAQITSGVGIVSNTEATPTDVISGAEVEYDGTTAILIEFSAPGLGDQDPARFVSFQLWDGATRLGVIAYSRNSGDTESGTTSYYGIRGARRLTPTAGAHTYHIKAYADSGGATVLAGNGAAGANVPAFMRITRAEPSTGPAGPQGPEGVSVFELLSYVEEDTGVAINQSSHATALTLVTAAEVTIEDGWTVEVEFFAPHCDIATQVFAALRFCLHADGTCIGRIAHVIGESGATGDGSWPVIGKRVLVDPGAITPIYDIRCYCQEDTDGNVFAGAGGEDNLVPMYIKVTRIA